MSIYRYPMLPSRAGRQILAVLAAAYVIERRHPWLTLEGIEGRLYRTNFNLEGELGSLVAAGYVAKMEREEFGSYDIVNEYTVQASGIRIAFGVLAQVSA